MRPPRKPPRRTQFTGPADELNHWSEVIRHVQSRTGRDLPLSHPAVVRLAALLGECPADNGSIVLQEHRALLGELRGDYASAVFHQAIAIDRVKEFIALEPIWPIDDTYLMRSQEKLASLRERLRRERG